MRLRSVIWTNRSGVARRGQKFCPQHFYVLQRTPLFKGPDWSCACKFKFIIFSCDSGIKQKQYSEPGGDWGDRFNRRLATEVILHTEVILCCTSLIKTHAVFCHALNTDNNLSRNAKIRCTIEGRDTNAGSILSWTFGKNATCIPVITKNQHFETESLSSTMGLLLSTDNAPNLPSNTAFTSDRLGTFPGVRSVSFWGYLAIVAICFPHWICLNTQQPTDSNLRL